MHMATQARPRPNVQFRCSHTMRERIEDYAEQSGMDVSKWMRLYMAKQLGIHEDDIVMPEPGGSGPTHDTPRRKKHAA